VKRVPFLALLVLVVAVDAGASTTPTLRGHGVTLTLPAGWHGLVGPAGVQAADFPLAMRARLSAGAVRVPHGHVHLIIWNGGPWVPYLPQYHAARVPLTLHKRDVLQGGLEGFPQNDAFARLEARLGGSMVEVLADLGPRPHVASALRKANSVLASLRILPPRVVRPSNGRLAADGVAVRLPSGWSGRMDVPADRYAARLVLRASRGAIHVVLLEYVDIQPPHHLDLPIVLASGNLLHSVSPPVARRVFSTSGRSFDLSVTVRSAGDLGEANRFLATLSVKPRPWTFRSCNLTLRVPGTWRVAVQPRNGCYPVLKLRGPRILVALTELRSGEHASGPILRRAGRRFQVEVTPASARARANAVLSTLHAKPRS
jgi:hypothetical protein